MKTPLALLINDLHINKDNIAEFQKNWDEAIEVGKKYNVGDIIIGGDLFTSRSSQTLPVLLAVKEALLKAVSHGFYITIARGNHDCIDPESSESYCDLYSHLSRVEIIKDWKCIAWGGCDWGLLVMCYFPEGGSFLKRFQDALESIKSDFSNFTTSECILYLHEGIHGALGDFEIPGELPQEPFLGFKSVLCGHYHNRTKIKNTPIEYIGSSRQNNFGEDEEKGYTILFSDGSTEFVKNQVNTRYKTVVLNADSIEDYQLVKESLYKYKVKVGCNEKQAKLFDKQKLIEKGFDKIEVVTESAVSKEVVASGISEKYDKLGIKREYQNYCEENSIDSRLGIKYLEG